MKYVEIIKFGKGYYVKRKIGGNITMTFVKTQAEVERLYKEWMNA